MKAVGVIGYHHTGKTTLVCTLISELTARGYKVMSIKDIHSEAYHADTDGKNTALHAQAGSAAVFAKGLYDSALLFPRSLDLREMVSYLKADYLIIEGLKDAPVPKIVCAATTEQLEELIDGTTIGISGIISDHLEEYRGLPVYCLQKNLSSLVQAILDKSFEILPISDPECCSACGKTCYTMAAAIVQGTAKRSDCVLDSSPDFTLNVNGEEVVIVPFVQKIIADVVTSLVDNLKGIDPDGDISLKIKR